jgi:hypothetical protein
MRGRRRGRRKRRKKDETKYIFRFLHICKKANKLARL